jgi:hypothetical protein
MQPTSVSAALESFRVRIGPCGLSVATNVFVGFGPSQACVDEDQRRVMKRTLQDAMDMIMHEKALKVCAASEDDSIEHGPVGCIGNVLHQRH